MTNQSSITITCNCGATITYTGGADISGIVIPEKVVKRLMTTTMMEHPNKFKKDKIPHVLRSIASQEGCDGTPYDQMIIAADYIELLEEIFTTIVHEAIKNENT